MRKLLYENDGSAARWPVITASAFMLLGLVSDSVSPHWILNSHSQCCEGNIDAAVATRPRQI
jgi:hypothetical protein